jgi:ribosomal protein S18 acetylase RimI-like enzyme
MERSQHDKLALTEDRMFVPASAYTFEQLAEIYNQTRVDYIVPMPMNSKRLADYVRFYDVDLVRSVVSLNEQQAPTGIIMVGVRGDHAWITRLGVMPGQRGRKIGQALMDHAIETLKAHGMHHIQLEVISGNEPAHQLFLKLGFVPQRELLVIRRPPKPTDTRSMPIDAAVRQLDLATISTCLQNRGGQVAWTEESASLLNTQALNGIGITLPSGESGWIIYQLSTFELTHIVLNPDASPAMMRALINQLHRQHPLHDTKIENIPCDHPTWSEFQQAGYMQVFSRIEMSLAISER